MASGGAVVQNHRGVTSDSAVMRNHGAVASGSAVASGGAVAQNQGGQAGSSHGTIALGGYTRRQLTGKRLLSQ